MFVNNLRLHARHLRRDLVADPWGLPEPAHTRLLLQGANGSGKSTMLEAIASLWELFGEWIDAGPGRVTSTRNGFSRHYLAEADIAAVELIGLLPGKKSLWIGMGKAAEWVNLKDEHPDAEFAGVVRSKSGVWEIQLPPGDWRSFRDQSLVGSAPQANIVYFPPTRGMNSSSGNAPQIVDFTPYNWLAKYAHDSYLPSLLLTVRAKDPGHYETALRLINQALDNQRKEITDLTSKGMRVRGKTEFGLEYEHPVGLLSSGEKQILLLIGFIAATMRPGGIVIIDEPDLHIHSVMVPQLLGSIEAIIRERNGQLIVAAHSQEVWDWFSLSSEQIELTPWRSAK